MPHHEGEAKIPPPARKTWSRTPRTNRLPSTREPRCAKRRTGVFVLDVETREDAIVVFIESKFLSDMLVSHHVLICVCHKEWHFHHGKQRAFLPHIKSNLT
jgi:hypothetical protein